MKFRKISSLYGSLISMFYEISAKKALSCSTNCCDIEPVLNKQKDLISWTREKYKNESLACTLTESKLAERKNELQKVVFSRIKNTKESETGFIFTFLYDEKFLLKMTEYIITEKRCCPFFTFEIKLIQSNEILLKISGPLESKKMLEMFLSEYN